MIKPYRFAVLFALAALGACAPQRHPLDEQLSQLQPVTTAALKELDWPAGTLLCPMTPYQSALPDAAPAAERVNTFLKRRKFLGDEGHWTLVVVKPGTTGDEGIEQLAFKRGKYDVITGAAELRKAAEAVPASFTPLDCVPVERVRVLATRGKGMSRTLISFGIE